PPLHGLGVTQPVTRCGGQVVCGATVHGVGIDERAGVGIDDISVLIELQEHRPAGGIGIDVLLTHLRAAVGGGEVGRRDEHRALGAGIGFAGEDPESTVGVVHAGVLAVSAFGTVGWDAAGDVG